MKDYYTNTFTTLKEDLQANRVGAEKAEVTLRKEEETLNAVRADAGDSVKCKTDCNNYVDDVSESLVKNINRIFLSDQPAGLISGIEPFVAILRNKMDAESVDVELFFKKHASLVAKMKRMEMRDMS